MQKKLSLIFLLSIFSFCTLSAETRKVEFSEKAYPDFSWDRVPVAMHLSKKTGDFTPDEVKFLAQADLIVIEKLQAGSKYNNAAKGAYVATKAIKKENKDTKILFYWNSRIDFGRLYQKKHFHDDNPSWKLVDLKGEPIKVRGYEFVYDVTAPGFIDWWVNYPNEAVDKQDMDGVFIDAVHQFFGTKDKYEKQLGVEKVAATYAGVDEMVYQMGKNLSSKNKIFITNNCFPNRNHGQNLHNYSNGGMYEHFCNARTDDADKMVEQIATVQQAAKAGGIVMVKCWPRYYFRRPELMQGHSKAQILANVREDIVFPLSCFLIAAEKYSYFMYSWGWTHSTGWLLDFPEYHRPLGQPLGDAVKDGYVYTRKYEHADVWVDLQTKKGKIDWKLPVQSDKKSSKKTKKSKK
ncbi:MAG: putative glycoside hydrolase [Rikenellaceae bacterium]